jgi:hypothetical protein
MKRKKGKRKKWKIFIERGDQRKSFIIEFIIGTTCLIYEVHRDVDNQFQFVLSPNLISYILNLTIEDVDIHFLPQ